MTQQSLQASAHDAPRVGVPLDTDEFVSYAHVRYAAGDEPGIIWFDPRDGHEYLSFDTDASIEALDVGERVRVNVRPARQAGPLRTGRPRTGVDRYRGVRRTHCRGDRALRRDRGTPPHQLLRVCRDLRRRRRRPGRGTGDRRLRRGRVPERRGSAGRQRGGQPMNHQRTYAMEYCGECGTSHLARPDGSARERPTALRGTNEQILPLHGPQARREDGPRTPRAG